MKTYTLEPKHMMYWNPVIESIAGLVTTWTKTYDVLKYFYGWCSRLFLLAWTKTYDVLKSDRMGFKKIWNITWTKTYDVLK